MWLPLTPAGAIDLAVLKSESRERLRVLFSDPATLSGLGMMEQPARAAQFTAQDCDFVWDLAGAIQTLIANRGFKVPADLAREILQFTAGERTLLAEPTVRVINKYAPGWLAEHKDETMFFLLLFAIERAKIQRLHAAVAERRQKEQPEKRKPEVPQAPGAEIAPQLNVV